MNKTNDSFIRVKPNNVKSYLKSPHKEIFDSTLRNYHLYRLQDTKVLLVDIDLSGQLFDSLEAYYSFTQKLSTSVIDPSESFILLKEDFPNNIPNILLALYDALKIDAKIPEYVDETYFNKMQSAIKLYGQEKAYHHLSIHLSIFIGECIPQNEKELKWKSANQITGVMYEPVLYNETTGKIIPLLNIVSKQLFKNSVNLYVAYKIIMLKI